MEQLQTGWKRQQAGRGRQLCDKVAQVYRSPSGRTLRVKCGASGFKRQPLAPLPHSRPCRNNAMH
jgi:hypothetical protein